MDHGQVHVAAIYISFVMSSTNTHLIYTVITGASEGIGRGYALEVMIFNLFIAELYKSPKFCSWPDKV